MTATTGPPDISEQAVTPARPAPPPMEKDWVLIGLVVAAISLIVALIGLGAMGFFHLDNRIDAQGAELRTAIGAQGAELRTAIDTQGAELRAAIDVQGAELRAAIDVQGAELRAAIDAQGAELREGFKHVDQRIDGLYDLIAQGKK